MDNDTQRFAGDEAANPSASKGFAGLIGSVASVRNERAALTAEPEGEIDFSDLPATQRKDWQGAQRGKFYRPIKQQLTVRVNADALAMPQKPRQRLPKPVKRYFCRAPCWVRHA
jgi:hypothetical protein